MTEDAKQLLARFGPKDRKTLTIDRQLGSARFSPCGRILAAGGLDGTVRRWDASSDAFTELPPIRGRGAWMPTIAFAPGADGGDGSKNSALLFSGDSWGGLAAWHVLEREAAIAWHIDQAHDGWLRCVATSPDGTILATSGLDRAVRLWSSRDGTCLGELAGHANDVFCVAFHPDGRSLVSGDLKGVIRHWNLETRDCERELDAGALFKLDRLQDVGGVRCLAFDSAGTALACGGTRPKVGGNVQGVPTILLYDWHTSALRQTIGLGAEGDGFVYDLHFHPAGFLAAVTSGNPGSGRFCFIRPPASEPFFVTTKMANCHSLAPHPNRRCYAVTATNGGSNGNGRNLDKNGQYPGNWSPVHLWDLPA